MTAPREKRRARHIAADEAHAWARSLDLKNPYAKGVLKSLSIYVNGEGRCFVGLDQLALDTDLSVDTVRRRMVWLEEIGAITRIPQWVDEHGRRNGDGRGKRTSDLIVLHLDRDADEIEARAWGVVESEVKSAVISPSRQQGLNHPPETVSPLPALGQPSHCCDHLNSEPEPESPPLPPSGGREAADALQEGEVEPEHFGAAWAGYPEHEAMRRDLALAEFRALVADDQKLCRAAVPDYAAQIRKLKWKPRAFHLWVRSGGFREFPNAKLPDERPPPPERRLIQGEELAGFTVALRIAERRDPVLVADQQLGRGVWRTMPVQPDLLALSAFVDDAGRDGWEIVAEGSERFAAWRDRLKLWLGAEPKAERIWLEPHDPSVHGLSPMHPNFRVRKSINGFRVPRSFPPRRDGTWSPAAGERA
ncbi:MULTISPECIES: hypothetical protein [unclassified Bradyrhizobium]|uniref:hypothetical protein n=1 Tax=unclassified Bradyrhizobium TaxID=2631580 RepID=UPI0028E32711|nr:MULTISPECIES: hypothetical protein [unclassified Bradyrhizobium]